MNDSVEGWFVMARLLFILSVVVIGKGAHVLLLIWSYELLLPEFNLSIMLLSASDVEVFLLFY